MYNHKASLGALVTYPLPIKLAINREKKIPGNNRQADSDLEEINFPR